MTFLDRIKSILGIIPDKLFYPGQEITPKQKCIWCDKKTGESTTGPQFGEIVRCLKYYLHQGAWHITITGYEGFFEEQWFAPVISDDQLEEMLNEIDELMVKNSPYDKLPHNEGSLVEMILNSCWLLWTSIKPQV